MPENPHSKTLNDTHDILTLMTHGLYFPRNLIWDMAVFRARDMRRALSCT